MGTNLTDQRPIRYHNLLRYLLLPLWSLFSFSSIFTFIAGLDTGVPFFMFQLIFSVVDLCLMVAAFVGFFRWRLYAWTCIMAHFVLSLLNAMYLLGVNISIPSDGLGDAVRSVASMILISVCSLVYYWKRRPMFSHS